MGKNKKSNKEVKKPKQPKKDKKLTEALDYRARDAS